MLTIKNIAATLAVMGSGAGLAACGGSQSTRASEVPASQTEAPAASCGGDKGEAACGGKKEASSGSAASGSEANCGAKAESSEEEEAGASATSPKATVAASSPDRKTPPRKHKPKGPAEAACGEGTCA